MASFAGNPVAARHCQAAAARSSCPRPQSLRPQAMARPACFWSIKLPVHCSAACAGPVLGARGSLRLSRNAAANAQRRGLHIACATGSSGTGDQDAPREGNEKVQDMLEDMIRLQQGRAEVNEFVADKAQVLTDIAKGADEDLRRIASGASESMEAANAKIMESVNSQVDELEAELAAAREEQRKRDQEFEEFEKQLINKQNDGLFFRSLYQSTKKPDVKPTKEEVLKANPGLANATAKAASSKTRRTLYGAFALLSFLTVAKSISDGSSLQSILVCSAISILLVFRVVYEFSLSDEEA